MENGEKYLITKAKNTQLSDCCASKAWIITAKTLYPNDFGVQFEAYQLEKNAENYEEAAKVFSYIIMTFKNNQNELLWEEISKLTDSLRVPELGTTVEQEFYVKMFQHISYDVQHKILLLTSNHSEAANHCKLILLLLKRFPQAITTHAPRLLDTLVQGMSTSPIQFRTMLVLEALPLIIHKPPELPSHIVDRILAISFEYYVHQMFQNTDDKKAVINESWKKIFEILELCGTMLKWEPFLPYNKNWSKDVYWAKIMEIAASSSPAPENKQVLFCSTILFIMTLQDYVNMTKLKMNESEIDFILVEGFREVPETPRSNTSALIETIISVNYPCTDETTNCLTVCANCWQFLHSKDIFKMDFTQILVNLPLSDYINRFLMELSVYMSRYDETATLLNEINSRGMSELEKNLRMLSLSRCHGRISMHSLDFIMACLKNLPTGNSGNLVKNMTKKTWESHLVLLPLTKTAVLQYCTTSFVEILKREVFNNPKCSDINIGNLLVLIQLGWPHNANKYIAEKIFDIIRTRQSFRYENFSYIINIDLIEEFMNMWYPHGGEIQLEFVPVQTNIGQRRIGTRGADKGVKNDFKQIIRQQIAKTNEDIENLMIHFILNEGIGIIKNVFSN